MSRIVFKSGLLCLFVLAFLAAAAITADAATINVTAGAPDVLNGTDGSCALREAITNINNSADTYGDCAPSSGTYGTNDTINLPAGTYTTASGGGVGEDSNSNGDLDIRSSVTITGAGAGSTIIDGGAFEHVLHVTGAYTVNISGVTIKNGNGWGGGGGIWNAGGILNISNSSVTGNTTTAGGWGGGIYNSSGTLTISNTTITGNTAPGGYGSGILNYGTSNITGSNISNNTAAASGGGVFNYTASVINITDSSISGNAATANGGGIDSSDGTITVTGSTIDSNTAGADGGGIGVNSGVTVTVTNSTLSGNTASHWGGGISSGGTVNLTNSTITANVANTLGGGIYRWGGTVNMKNTIVAGQTTGGDCNANVDTTLNDLDSDGTCGVGTTADPLLGPLADNGGPTQTHALLAGSPAIDAGDDATCAAAPVNGVDQRGVSRPQDGDGDKTAVCDIGAFELQITSVPAMTPWGIVVFILLAGLGAVWRLRYLRWNR